MNNLPTTETEFDSNLNRLDSLLQGLGITANVSAGSIESGVFGSNSATTGLEFGVSPSAKTSYLQSRNFVSGTTGWQILSDGTAQFMSITLTGGTVKYGKTSFTDSTNAGYYIGAEGVYFGAASDATKLKYTISGGAFDFIGTISSRSTATLASAIDSAGAFINANLDTSAKTILGSFTFGVSGAIQIGTYSAGVSGDIKISPNGIVGRNSANANTFTIDATTGNATFAGTLSGASGTFGTITAGTISGVTITGSTLSTGTTGDNVDITTGRISQRTGTTEVVYSEVGSYGGGWGIKDLAGNSIASWNVRNSGANLQFNVDVGNLYIQSAGDVIFVGTTGNDIYPATDNKMWLGTGSNRWADVRSVLINGADYCFENGFRITEEKDFGISFYNPKDEKIMTLDKEGNLWLRGSIYPNINMKKNFPFYRKGDLIKNK